MRRFWFTVIGVCAVLMGLTCAQKEKPGAGLNTQMKEQTPALAATDTPAVKETTASAAKPAEPEKPSSEQKPNKPAAVSKSAVKEEKPSAPEEPQTDYQVTFIEFGSVNCMPCRMMQPIMAQIEKEYAGKVRVLFYDVWTEGGRRYAEPYGIRVIPTQVFLDKAGKEFFRHEGYFPKAEIVKVLESQGIKN